MFAWLGLGFEFEFGFGCGSGCGFGSLLWPLARRVVGRAGGWRGELCSSRRTGQLEGRGHRARGQAARPAVALAGRVVVVVRWWWW